MSPRNVVVTGANRGIGLGLVKEFLKLDGVKNVFATTRNPSTSTELNAIKDNRLQVVKMDVDDDESIKKAYNEISDVVGSSGLNLLVNNAGVLYPYKVNDVPDRVALQKNLYTNAISPLVVTQTFLPLLRKAATSEVFSVESSAIVNISSFLASIAGNADGSTPRDFLGYRISKTALNQVAKTLSVDLAPEGILVANFCPGWVQTDMGGKEAAITVDQSAKALVDSMCKLDKSHNGGFFQNTGEVIPY